MGSPVGLGRASRAWARSAVADWSTRGQGPRTQFVRLCRQGGCPSTHTAYTLRLGKCIHPPGVCPQFLSGSADTGWVRYGGRVHSSSLEVQTQCGSGRGRVRSSSGEVQTRRVSPPMSAKSGVHQRTWWPGVGAPGGHNSRTQFVCRSVDTSGCRPRSRPAPVLCSEARLRSSALRSPPLRSGGWGGAPYGSQLVAALSRSLWCEARSR